MKYASIFIFSVGLCTLIGIGLDYTLLPIWESGTFVAGGAVAGFFLGIMSVAVESNKDRNIQ